MNVIAMSKMGAQILSRNSVTGDRVAISVGGHAGLVRFIRLPPVEAKKIPDIVKYEARQQIPFDLNDVIWDYQRMGGGSEEEGFALEAEIGLFAMKRDAVFAPRSLAKRRHRGRCGAIDAAGAVQLRALRSDARLAAGG